MVSKLSKPYISGSRCPSKSRFTPFAIKILTHVDRLFGVEFFLDGFLDGFFDGSLGMDLSADFKWNIIDFSGQYFQAIQLKNASDDR